MAAVKLTNFGCAKFSYRHMTFVINHDLLLNILTSYKKITLKIKN